MTYNIQERKLRQDKKTNPWIVRSLITFWALTEETDRTRKKTKQQTEDANLSSASSVILMFYILFTINIIDWLSCHTLHTFDGLDLSNQLIQILSFAHNHHDGALK